MWLWCLFYKAKGSVSVGHCRRHWAGIQLARRGPRNSSLSRVCFKVAVAARTSKKGWRTGSHLLRATVFSRCLLAGCRQDSSSLAGQFDFYSFVRTALASGTQCHVHCSVSGSSVGCVQARSPLCCARHATTVLKMSPVLPRDPRGPHASAAAAMASLSATAPLPRERPPHGTDTPTRPGCCRADNGRR